MNDEKTDIGREKVGEEDLTTSSRIESAQLDSRNSKANLNALGFSDGDNKVIELVQDSMWKLVSALIKGTAFYFAISAALIGYIIKINDELPIVLYRFILIGGLTISVLFMIAAGSCVNGILVCNKVTKKALFNSAFTTDEANVFFDGVKRTMLFIAICSALVFTIFMVGMLLMLINPINI